jgi:hypothetical protein
MNKHTVAITAAVGTPLGFLAGILYSIWREHDQQTHSTINQQGASIDKISGKIDDLAFHQRNLWGSIHKLQGDVYNVSKGSQEPAS